MADGSKPELPTDNFHSGMDAANIGALWERPSHGAGAAGGEAPFLWKWDDIDPLIDAAVDATDMGNAERRVLCMENPAYADRTRGSASLTFVVNFQVLMPGESARPHRHSANALRFIVEGDGGAITTVDGKACPMHPGDFLITPAWTWHEHIHKGEGRAVWLDALDVPMQLFLDINEFEPGPSNNIPPQLPEEAVVHAGLSPVTNIERRPYSPMFRYPWDKVREALAAMPSAGDGSRRLRYSNPETGGVAMPGIDCYMMSLQKGQDTEAYRTNANMVCLVVDGEGTSQIGDETVHWSKNDTFTLPRNHWITHRGTSSDAHLFQMTDRETLARLDYLREEFRT